MRFGIFSKFLSLNEEIILYYRYFSTKMFMENMLLKCGIKVWVVGTAKGYAFALQIQVDKCDSCNNMPLQKSTVSDLIAVTENNK